MMNPYIKSILNRKNEFRVEAEFSVFQTRIVVDNLKNDTGCGFTTFPLKKLGAFTESEAKQFKMDDISNDIPYQLSYGVETGGQKHKLPMTFQDKMDCPAISFFKTIQDFSICGIPLNDRDIRINYDRTGNLLLGMDVLKDWDIHIGTLSNGETMLLGCPRNRINDEYLSALNTYFRI